MKILKVRLRSTREFEQYYDKSLEFEGLFCPTTTPLKVGERVIVELSMPALPNKVMIRGVVRDWRPALPRLRVRAGALVEFDEDEVLKRDFVLESLAGNRPSARRRKHSRLPVSVPVRFRTLDTHVFTDSELSEISVGGGMLSTGEPLALETDVVLEITPPGGVSPISISGKATYHGPNGGTGLKFLYRDAGGSRRLRELVRRLRVNE